MSFRRMTRMISFRVSEDEFEQLRHKSEAQGARSVSDYARVALCGSSNALDGHAERDIQDLSDGLERLSVDVRRLADLIEGPPRTLNGPRSIATQPNGGRNA